MFNFDLEFLNRLKVLHECYPNLSYYLFSWITAGFKLAELYSNPYLEKSDNCRTQQTHILISYYSHISRRSGTGLGQDPNGGSEVLYGGLRENLFL